MKLSFPPVVDNNTHILILGTLPGEESLRQKKYYANPRNFFWPIIFKLFDQPVPRTYEEKIDFLKSKGIGLWDVIRNAERKGSVDSKIRKQIPNDLADLLQQYPNIKTLIFNGHKAEEAFARLIKEKQNLPLNLSWKYFPSTSPAYTGKSFEMKLAKWSRLKELI